MDSAIPQSFIILAKGNLHKILVVLFVYILCLKLFPSKESSGFLSWWQNALFRGFNNPPVFYSSKHASISSHSTCLIAGSFADYFRWSCKWDYSCLIPKHARINSTGHWAMRKRDSFLEGWILSTVSIFFPDLEVFLPPRCHIFSCTKANLKKDTLSRHLTILCRWSYWRN